MGHSTLSRDRFNGQHRIGDEAGPELGPGVLVATTADLGYLAHAPRCWRTETTGFLVGAVSIPGEINEGQLVLTLPENIYAPPERWPLGLGAGTGPRCYLEPDGAVRVDASAVPWSDGFLDFYAFWPLG